jgi:peptide/nickel transport system substrate-binding protein
MGTILSPASPFSVPLPIEHDLAEARRLAKEVLGEKRVQVRFIFPSWSLERYPYKEQAEYIQSVLRELGIDAQIQILEGGAFNEAMKAGEYEIAMRNQGLPNAEPNTIFTWYVLSDGAGNVEYHLNFKDQEADALILQARREMDMEKRFQMYARVQEIAKEGYHWIPLFNNVDLLVYNKRLKGFRSLGKKYDVTLWEAYLE